MDMELVRGRVLTGHLALALIALAAATTATAQTPLQAQLGLRPVTNDDISAYKLPSTTQKSGGLSTVGLGQPAYLEARVNVAIPASDVGGVVWTLTNKPAGSNAQFEESPLGTDVLMYEPADRLVSRVAGRKMLRPDVPGRYQVTASISTATNGTTDVTLTILASTYVGIQACAQCHGGGPAGTPWSMVESWSQTGHAVWFKKGIDGELEGGTYGTGCISCHTVGYDANAKAANGGFDDMAAQLKWVMPAVFKPGNFAAMPPALKNVANIQCENCHGPGSEHVANGGDPRFISISLNSGDCGQCHGALTHHIKSGEWATSGHAVTPSTPSGPGREACVGCHTAAGFIGRMKGSKTVNTSYNPVNCQTCHDPHGRTAPAGAPHLLRSVSSVQLMDGTNVTDGGAGLLCMNCHQSRVKAADYAPSAPADPRFGPHHGPQADMLAGTNGYTYGQTIPSSAHGYAVEDTCVGCHMQTVAPTDPLFLKAGGHTFKPGSADGGDLVGKCQSCHGSKLDSFNFALLDYNGDGKIEGVQTEVQHLLDQLSSLLPPVGKPKSSLSIDATWTRPQLEGGYNWLFVKEDGSSGIHNTAYTVGLLKASIANLSPAK
jgi:hypothetical protein